MRRVRLVTFAERAWHWLNAALFLALMLTGFLMHGTEHLARPTLGTLILAHNLAAGLFVANFGFFLAYQLGSRRILHYFRLERDFPLRLYRQARFYLLDIFAGRGHPYQASADSKFNPLQRATYVGLMFGLVPLQIASGLVMWGFSRRVEWLTDLPLFRLIALSHTALAFALLAFLVGHLYLATTGRTPLALLKTMITGWHEEGEEEEST